LLKRAIDIASEKRGVRMRVNEGPSILDSIVAKASNEREREKDDDASVPAQSSSRERARADKDPDVPAPQGAAWCRLVTQNVTAQRQALARERRSRCSLVEGLSDRGSCSRVTARVVETV
jgi:hypothetical protein